MSRVHRYVGKAVTVTFDTERCIHAAECVRGLPEVFNTKKTPWVAPDKGSPDALTATIARCPTGALKAFAGERRIEDPDSAATATLSPRGPLFLRGRLRLLNAAGDTLLEDYRIALCRCGASASKPFCDNRHKALPFQDPGTMSGTEITELGEGGELVLRPLSDGPIQVDGPLLIRDASGKVRYAGAETWLCRCGNSAEKPFCDGSHKSCGFKAP